MFTLCDTNYHCVLELIDLMDAVSRHRDGPRFRYLTALSIISGFRSYHAQPVNWGKFLFAAILQGPLHLLE